ncbi:MAG: hypothetical protein IJU76_09000 [Desulfovibrionaceae bacterium]|nr:hypothetical protein [Desulfovibrionaceae bacterium]
MEKKQKQTKQSCFVCRTVYSNPSMVNRCMKTAACKQYNYPSRERKEAYFTQFGVASCLLFFLQPLEKYLPDEHPARPCVQKIRNPVEQLFSDINEIFVNPMLFKKQTEELVAILKTDFPEKKTAASPALHELLTLLLEQLTDSLEDFFKKNPALKTIALWTTIQKELADGAQAFCDADSASFRSELYDIISFLWPPDPQKQEKPLQLYLINDKIWVVAATSKEAREIVKKELGLVQTSAERIEKEEILDDQRRAGDLIALAHGKAMIIGRTE